MPSIVALDIETTGLDPQRDAIIEIAAVRFNSRRIEDQWSTLINPRRPISEFITNLTGITNNMVNGAPQIEEVLPELEDFVADLPTDVVEIAEGSQSSTVTPHGKDCDGAAVGVHGANDYTMWFAEDPTMAGTWCGYDGPAPPWNESILHHYTFTVYALDTESLGLEGGFSRRSLDEAMDGHVLASAAITGSYASNPSLR